MVGVRLKLVYCYTAFAEAAKVKPQAPLATGLGIKVIVDAIIDQKKTIPALMARYVDRIVHNQILTIRTGAYSSNPSEFQPRLKFSQLA